MEGINLLLVLCFLMLVGSFFPGYLPLLFNWRSATIHYISAFGAGLLVGTALVVILPEGVHKLVHCPFDAQHQLKLIGASLAAGFVFMLAVDHILGGGHHHAHRHAHTHSHNHTHHHNHSHSEDDDEENIVSRNQESENAAPIIGLLVHAAVDGVALGSVASSHLESVELIVFIALMLHKAPAAFGLSTFLLSQNRSMNEIVRYLFAFSFAAPVACVITYVYLTIQERGDNSHDEDEHHQENRLAIMLLFSAGTFLFVSTMHILPEIKAKGLTWREVLIISAGILLPTLLSSEHHH